jgi:hypothetical protein
LSTTQLTGISDELGRDVMVQTQIECFAHRRNLGLSRPGNPAANKSNELMLSQKFCPKKSCDVLHCIGKNQRPASNVVHMTQRSKFRRLETSRY